MQNLLSERESIEASAALVASADGDAPAFKQRFVELTMDTVFRRCLVRLGNHADAEDAAQDCILRLLDSAKAFKQERILEAWIAWHVQISCSRLRRKQMSQLRRKEVYAHMHTMAEQNESERVDEALLLQEQGEQIRCALIQLKESDRQVIELHYFDGLTQLEIAETLKIKENTVSVRMHRARSRLKKLLGSVSLGVLLAAMPSMLQATPPISLSFQQACVSVVSGVGQAPFITLTTLEKAIYLMKSHPIIASLCAVSILFGLFTANDLLAQDQDKSEAVVAETALDYVFTNSLDDYYHADKLPMKLAYEPDGDAAYKERNGKIYRNWWAMTKTMEVKYKDKPWRPVVFEGASLSVLEMLDVLVKMSPTSIHYRVDGFIPVSKTVSLSLKGKSISDVFDLYGLQYAAEEQGVVVISPEAEVAEKMDWCIWKDETHDKSYYWYTHNKNICEILSERMDGRVSFDEIGEMPKVSTQSMKNCIHLLQKVNGDWTGQSSLRGVLELLEFMYGLDYVIRDRDIVLSKASAGFLGWINNAWAGSSTSQKLSDVDINQLPDGERRLLKQALDTELAIDFKGGLNDALLLLSQQVGLPLLCSSEIEYRALVLSTGRESISLLKLMDEIAKQSSAEIIIYKGVIILVPRLAAGA